MAYLDTRSTRPSPAAIAAVIGIHATLGYALVTGLAAEFVEEIYSGPLPTRDYPAPEIPPPPPPDEKTVEPTESSAPPVHAPTPPVNLVREPVEVEVTPALLPPIEDIFLTPPPATGELVTPKPSPKPGLDPVAARPSNNPGNWVTTNDYPSRAIREEWEGTTGIKVTVGTDGRPQDCTVTASSGHAVLDEATCSRVMKRARFKAALDGFGEKTLGSFSTSVRWQLPN